MARGPGYVEVGGGGERRRLTSTSVALGALVAGALLAGGAVVGSVARRAGLSGAAFEARVGADVGAWSHPAAVSLRVSSPYERRLGRPIGDGQYSFDYLVDVSQNTLLELQPSDVRAHWEIDGALVSNGTSAQIEVRFENVGTHVVVVRFQSGASKAFEVTSRVVRRELRELTDKERGAYFGAVFTLYAMDDEPGKARFGPTYFSAAWLVREHLYGAADRDCDDRGQLLRLLSRSLSPRFG